MFCTNCGKEIFDDAVMCVGCGSTVKSDKSNKLKKAREYLFEPTEDRSLRIMHGLFTGICSGLAITRSIPLTILITIAVICYALKGTSTINVIEKMHAANATVFTVVFAYSFMHSVNEVNSHRLLTGLSLIEKIAYGPSLIFAFPGLISLIKLFIVYRWRKLANDVDEKQMRLCKIRNVLLASIYICLALTVISGKIFKSKEPLTLDKLAKLGWYNVEGKIFTNSGTIKQSSSGRITLETVEADEISLNQHMYEVDCNNMNFRELDQVEWFNSGPTGRSINSEMLPISFAGSALTKVINEVCKGGGRGDVVH